MVMAATPRVSSSESSPARTGTLKRKLAAISSRRLLAAAIVTVVNAVVGHMATAASITPLLDPSVSGTYTSEIFTISGDGTTAGGFLQPTGSSLSSYIWQNGVPTDLGTGTGAPNPFTGRYVSQVQAIGAGGTVTAGRQTNGGTQEAYIQTGSTRTVLPGPNTGAYSEVRGLTADGQTALGETRISSGVYDGWTWNATAGYTLIGTSVRTYGISADGTIVAGQVGTTPTRWVNGTPESLPLVTQGYEGRAVAVSQDNSTVVGTETDPVTFVQTAVRWAGGTVTPLLGAGFDESQALDVSGDGLAVVGWQNDIVNYDRKAFLWTPDLGVVDLNVYLPTLGVDLTGWDLQRAWGISDDGMKIAGYGQYNGVKTGFVADVSVVPEPSTFGLAAIGIAGAGLAFRRRQLARRSS